MHRCRVPISVLETAIFMAKVVIQTNTMNDVTGANNGSCIHKKVVGSFDVDASDGTS